MAGEWPTLALENHFSSCSTCDDRTSRRRPGSAILGLNPRVRAGSYRSERSRAHARASSMLGTRKATPIVERRCLVPSPQPGRDCRSYPTWSSHWGEARAPSSRWHKCLLPSFVAIERHGGGSRSVSLSTWCVFEPEMRPKFLSFSCSRHRRSKNHSRHLGTLDDKIELNRRMNETLEAMARALFKSWFVDFDPVRAKAEGRDPGLAKLLVDLFPNSFEDSELGEIPSGWQVGPILDHARLMSGARRRPIEPSTGMDRSHGPAQRTFRGRAIVSRRDSTMS